jgi:hypothetical protein
MKSVFVFPPLRKHQAGQHDQSTHGSWSNLSEKERLTQEKITNIKTQEPSADGEFTGGVEATYESKNGQKIRLTHDNFKYPDGKIEMETSASVSIDGGFKQVGFLTSSRSSNFSGDATIDSIFVESDYQRMGIATAMLTIARNYSQDKIQINHSFSLTEDAEGWAGIVKHLAGQHDQQSHGNWASEAGIPIPKNPDGTFVEAVFPKDFHKKLTEKEFQSVGNYQHDGYKEINKVLRNPKNFEEPYQQYMSSTIEAIDSAIVKAGEVVPDNTAVFRVVHDKFFMGAPVLGVPPIEIGSVITDKGYTSTTMIDLSKLTQDEKSSYARSNKMLIRIDLGKNKSGLAVNSIYENTNKVGLFTLQEREFLLPRGTSFEYAGFDKVNKIHVLKRLP